MTRQISYTKKRGYQTKWQESGNKGYAYQYTVLGRNRHERIKVTGNSISIEHQFYH